PRRCGSCRCRWPSAPSSWPSASSTISSRCCCAGKTISWPTSSSSHTGYRKATIMDQFYVIGIFLLILLLLLGSGVWVGLALLGCAYIGIELFTSRPTGDAMMTVLWRASSSWSLTALPLFIWMGEILYRTR